MRMCMMMAVAAGCACVHVHDDGCWMCMMMASVCLCVLLCLQMCLSSEGVAPLPRSVAGHTVRAASVITEHCYHQNAIISWGSSGHCRRLLLSPGGSSSCHHRVL